MGGDSFLYGVTTVGIVNGTYGFTNELLQESAEKFDQELNFPREVTIEYIDPAPINNETIQEESPSRPTSYNFTISIDELLEEIP